MPAQHDVYQSADAIDCATQLPPSALHPAICLINVPTGANAAFASLTQVRQLGLPIAHRFIVGDEPVVMHQVDSVDAAVRAP
jgi:hypothetical protein